VARVTLVFAGVFAASSGTLSSMKKGFALGFAAP
jgi:hypothetical protein